MRRRAGDKKYLSRQKEIDSLIDTAKKLPVEAESTVAFMRFVVKEGRARGDSVEQVINRLKGALPKDFEAPMFKDGEG